MNKIPVIGTAIVNTVSWLEKLIASVNYPTENFVIINNNGRGQLTEDINNLCKQKHPFIEKFHPVHLPSNIGCSGAWNLIIKLFMNSPYWILTGHDIEFTDGFLDKMVSLSKPDKIGMVHGHEGPLPFMGGYSLFLIKDWVIRDFGLFDENFYPGYLEDTDYEMRVINCPIVRHVTVGIPYKHGGTFEYGVSGSQTWRSDLTLKDKIDYGHYLNATEYMEQKWGPNWRHCQPYKYPFNIEGTPISATKYDLSFVRRKNLGF